jgi:hypothetical protein
MNIDENIEAVLALLDRAQYGDVPEGPNLAKIAQDFVRDNFRITDTGSASVLIEKITQLLTLAHDAGAQEVLARKIKIAQALRQVEKQTAQGIVWKPNPNM